MTSSGTEARPRGRTALTSSSTVALPFFSVRTSAMQQQPQCTTNDQQDSQAISPPRCRRLAERNQAPRQAFLSHLCNALSPRHTIHALPVFHAATSSTCVVKPIGGQGLNIGSRFGPQKEGQWRIFAVMEPLEAQQQPKSLIDQAQSPLSGSVLDQLHEHKKVSARNKTNERVLGYTSQSLRE